MRGSLALLLVEDDRQDALLVEELIADTSMQTTVTLAPSLAEAERQIAINRPDCVLLDMNLPDGTGLLVLERITRLDVTLPIVVLTGFTDEHFGVSAVGAGAQDYLVKGRVEPEMLQRALLYAIERKRAELTAVDLHASELRARKRPGWSAVCCPHRCSSTIPASTSSPGTGPAGRTPCWAATSTTSSKPRIAPCT